MKLTTIILLFFFGSFTLVSQEKGEFVETKATGEIPVDFIRLLSDKYKSDVDGINKKEKRKDKKTKKQFYLESNFFVNDVITSGNVLFNDVYTTYLNEIYKEIALNNPSLHKEKIYFYAIKSTEVNAFATHPGIILFNIGLLAKMKSEDELAYIMCHEIAHVVKKHNIKQHIFNEEVDKKKGAYKKENWEVKLFSKSNYSKKQESQADLIGFEYFIKTKYNTGSAISALQKLKTAYLPYDQVEKTPGIEILKNPFVALPNLETFEGKREELVEESEESDKKEKKKKKDKSEEEDFGSHPAVNLRIKAIETRIAEKEINVKEQNPLPNKVRKNAMYELPHLFLEKGAEVHALYCLLLLSEEGQNSEYLKGILAKTLYANAQRRTYIEEYKEPENEIKNQYVKSWKRYTKTLAMGSTSLYSVHKWLEGLSDTDLNAIALQTNYKQLKAGSKGSDGTSIRIKGLMKEYWAYYSELESDNDIVSVIRSAHPELAKKEEKVEPEEKEPRAGIDNLVILSPEYRQFDLRDDQIYKYISSEDELLQYDSKIEINADKLDLDYKLLSATKFKDFKVDEFNDLVLVNNFLRENSVTTPNCVSSKKDEIIQLTEKYGTDKLALMGVYSFVGGRNVAAQIFVIVYGLIIPPLLPLSILYAVTPEYQTFNYTVVYDLTSEESIFVKVHAIHMRDKRGVVNISLYDHLEQVKKGEK